MGGALVFNKNEIRRRAEMDREFRQRERDEAKRRARKPRKSLVVGRIPEDFLHKAYLVEKKSMREIAGICSCSIHKVSYWITAYSIPVRNQSEAVYGARNKGGDPFSFNVEKVDLKSASFLLGLGLGLYWETGSYSGRAVKIGSNDPKIVCAFIRFLVKACGVKKSSLRFGLQITDGVRADSARSFWANALAVSEAQFQKPTVIRKRSSLRVNNHGFLNLYFFNSKLKRILLSEIGKIDI
jgi:hypothetical protein